MDALGDAGEVREPGVDGNHRRAPGGILFVGIRVGADAWRKFVDAFLGIEPVLATLRCNLARVTVKRLLRFCAGRVSVFRSHGV